MTPLRWLGVVLGCVLLGVAVSRRRRLFRGDVLLIGALALAIVAVSATGWATVLLNDFGFKAGGGRQVLGVVVFASVVLLLLIALALSRISGLSHDFDRMLEGVASHEFRDTGGVDVFAGAAAIVIPAYNEAENIGPVLDGLPREVCGLRTSVLVIDDGSTDDTGAAARAHGAVVVRHVINRGQGAAMRTGYRVIAETDAAVVIAMDADGQHRAEDMEDLVAPVVHGEVALTNGSRTLPGAGSERVHVMRDLGIVFFNRLISLLTRTRVTDCSNGYRAMKPEILPDFVLKQNQFHNSEFLIEAIKRGVPTREVPVTVVHRLSGSSKKPAVIRYGLGFTNAIFRTWLR
jgi:hypothetical protein